jgi:hypothetical protein
MNRVLLLVLLPAFCLCVSVTVAQYVFPLKASADGRYFTDQNDKPFFLNGESAWDLPIDLTYADAKRYIDNLDSTRFTAVTIRMITHSGYSRFAPANAYNVAPFIGAWWTTPNQPYWKHIDSLFDLCAAKNIVVWAFPDYLGYGGAGTTQGFYDQTASATAATMKTYGQFLGNRYKNWGNIIWSVGGDCDPTAVATQIDSMVAGMKQYIPNLIITSRDEPETWASGHLGGRSWFSFNGFYSYSATMYQWGRGSYNWIGNRTPFILEETAYENEHASTPQSLRAQAWWAVLGGATAGQFFGNCPVWNFSQYSCTGTPWTTALYSPGRTSMKWLGKILMNRNWHKLVPDTARVVMTAGTGTYGATDYATTAYASDSTTIIAYLPGKRAVTVSPSKLKGPTIHVWWVNPADGTVADSGTVSKSGRVYNQPADGDWVLVIDAASMNYPPPGTDFEDPPLPVELEYFRGDRTSDGSVHLEWKTRSEVNNFGFEIQRRFENAKDYNELADSFVGGTGTTTVPHEYSYVDRTANSGGCWFRLKQIDLDGIVHLSRAVFIDASEVKNGVGIPTEHSLDQNYPNPFNPSTRINYWIPTPSHVRLEVLNIVGQKVMEPVNRWQEAGSYSIALDASGLAAGVYICRIEAGNRAQARKMVLIK